MILSNPALICFSICEILLVFAAMIQPFYEFITVMDRMWSLNSAELWDDGACSPGVLMTHLPGLVFLAASTAVHASAVSHTRVNDTQRDQALWPSCYSSSCGVLDIPSAEWKSWHRAWCLPLPRTFSISRLLCLVGTNASFLFSRAYVGCWAHACFFRVLSPAIQPCRIFVSMSVDVFIYQVHMSLFKGPFKLNSYSFKLSSKQTS